MAENTNPLTQQQQKEIVKELQKRGGNISLMVAGKTGTGKSTLINSFLGLDHDNGGAREGDEGMSVTKSVSSYKAEKNGVVIECWDTLGFEDTTNHSTAKIIAQMSVKTNEKMDLLLYCMKYEIGMRVDDGHRRIIREITMAFKNDIWKRAVFVMTMVNIVLPSVSEHQRKTKLETIGNKLRDSLRENGVPDQIASNVPLVTAGYEEGILPHETTEWTAKLLGHCLARVDTKATLLLLKIRYKKKFLTKIIRSMAKAAEQRPGAGTGVGAGVDAGVGAGVDAGETIVAGGLVGAGGGIVAGGLAGAGAGATIGALIGAFGGPPGAAVGVSGGAIIGAIAGASGGAVFGGSVGGVAISGWILASKIGSWIEKFDKEVHRDMEVEREMKKLSCKTSERSEEDKKNV